VGYSDKGHQYTIRVDDINAEDEFGATCVLRAAANGHIEAIDFLVDKYKADVHHVDKNGANAAMYAAKGGHLAVVEALFARGVSTDAVDKDGFSVLDYVFECRNDKGVRTWSVGTTCHWSSNLQKERANMYVQVENMIKKIKDAARQVKDEELKKAKELLKNEQRHQEELKKAEELLKNEQRHKEDLLKASELLKSWSFDAFAELMKTRKVQLENEIIPEYRCIISGLESKRQKCVDVKGKSLRAICSLFAHREFDCQWRVGHQRMDEIHGRTVQGEATTV